MKLTNIFTCSGATIRSIRKLALLTLILLLASCASASSTRIEDFGGFNVPHVGAPGVMLPHYLDDDFPVCIEQSPRPLCITYHDLSQLLRSRRAL